MDVEDRQIFPSAVVNIPLVGSSVYGCFYCRYHFLPKLWMHDAHMATGVRCMAWIFPSRQLAMDAFDTSTYDMNADTRSCLTWLAQSTYALLAKLLLYPFSI